MAFFSGLNPNSKWVRIDGSPGRARTYAPSVSRKRYNYFKNQPRNLAVYFLYGIAIAFSVLWNLKPSVTNKLNDQTSQSAVELEREYSFFISQPSKIIPCLYQVPQHYAYITQTWSDANLSQSLNNRFVQSSSASTFFPMWSPVLRYVLSTVPFHHPRILFQIVLLTLGWN